MSKKLLETYIRNIIKEVYDTKDLDNITKELEKIVSKHKLKLMTKNDGRVYFFMTREIIAKLSELGFKLLGRGATRIVYQRDQDPFVIKVNDLDSFQEYRIPANKSEIMIGTGYHGLDAIDIVPKIINYDRFYKDNPVWIIAEKVTPLDKVDLDTLSKVFVTFHKSFQGDSLLDNIVFVMSNMLSQSVGDSAEDIPLHQMTYQDFVDLYCDIVQYQYSDDEIDITFLQNLREGKEKAPDLRRLIQCMKYVQTSDLHEENIGIRRSSVPSPDDIVILDFDANY